MRNSSSWPCNVRVASSRPRARVERIALYCNLPVLFFVVIFLPFLISCVCVCVCAMGYAILFIQDKL